MIHYYAYPGLKKFPKEKLSLSVERTQQLKAMICEHYGIPVSKMEGKCRDQELVRARFTYFYICRTQLGMGWKAISRTVGRDHTTSIYGVEQVEAWKATNDPFYRDVKECLTKYEKGWHNN
jgi:chromosomal replication initiation ATPase DnaA